jgi:outer membrane protein OmpU
MNKLTKVGLSALCGSLASISAANAGEMAVTGGATATWSSNTGAVTGNPIGMNSGITFKGSGELDNGSTFTLTITQADQIAYSAGSISIATPSLGTFAISSRSGGTGIGGHDDKMPTAWEETWGTSLGTGIDLPKGVSSSMNFAWTSPSFAGSTLKFAVAPGAADATFNNDKGVSAAADAGKQGGYDILLDMNPSFGSDALSGLKVWVGGSVINQDKEKDLSKGNTDDAQTGIAGTTFAYGPVTLGYQRSIEMTGLETAGTVQYYQNDAFGISFNINDDLSISYGEMESTKHVTNNTGNNKFITTVDSIQVAYSMGGMSLKLAESSVDDATYANGGTGSDFDATTIALTLAF